MSAALHVTTHGHSRRYLDRVRRYLPLKRFFDVAICSLLLLPIGVIGLLCALAIWLDSPGAIIFRQTRTGRGGQNFNCLKFRTMVRNADELKASLAHLNVLPPPDFKIPNDPRVTRVGRILRKTSLDELPQILNVLRGEMSLVGPRPCSIKIDAYSLWHAERLEVPPGITGLWQIEGRNVTSFDERLRLDIKYISSMSLWQDIKLILRTIPAVLKGRGE